MLTIHGMNVLDMEAEDDIIVHATGKYFDVSFKEEWLNDPFIRCIIADIDKIDVLDTLYPTTALLALRGHVTPYQLANGTKNLILCKYEKDVWHRLSHMGENCFKWLMDIAENSEVHMVATFSRVFTEADLKGRSVYFADLDRYVSDERSFLLAMVDLDLNDYFKRRGI